MLRNFDGRLSTRITYEELVALSLVLGSPVKNTATTAKDITAETGAFKITILSTPLDDGKHQISLRQHKRKISQLPCGGSTPSPLFAKHLACGSLPFSQDSKSINSILITYDSLEALQSGAFMMRKGSHQTPQSKFLNMLPSSRELTFYTLETSPKPTPSTPLIDAIAMLPFSGGLVPLASTPLIKTVQFVASSGIPAGRLLQRLEALVDKVHRHSPHLKIFGPLYEPQTAGLLFRERERLGKVAAGVTTEDLADKVARMQRYVTLLERLMALVPNMKSQDVLAAVREATKKEMQRSYNEALAAHSSVSRSSATSPQAPIIDTHSPDSDARSKHHSRSDNLAGSARRSPRSSLGSETSNLGRQSNSFPVHNLGKQVETFLKAELPLSIESIATIARLIVVAWTLSVEEVAWEEGEFGFRLMREEEVDGKMVLV